MDTWYYAKRCFCALIETLTKHLIILKDTSISEILDFLDAADQYGKAIKTVKINFIFSLHIFFFFLDDNPFGNN